MSNNKKSSIDWLVSELTNLGYIFAPSFGHKIIDEKIKQAKAMHKEEIMKAFNKGHNMDQNNIWADAEWYYIVIFGGNNEQQ